MTLVNTVRGSNASEPGDRSEPTKLARVRARVGESEGRSTLGLKLVVLAIFARGASELPPEFARKVALIREAALQGDVGQRGIRVHQGTTRNAQPELSQNRCGVRWKVARNCRSNARSDMFEMDARSRLVIS